MRGNRPLLPPVASREPPVASRGLPWPLVDDETDDIYIYIYIYSGSKSADPSGLRVEPVSFPPILRTFLLSNLILLTLQARREVYLPPSPLLGLGSAGGVSPQSSLGFV